MISCQGTHFYDVHNVERLSPFIFRRIRAVRYVNRMVGCYHWTALIWISASPLRFCLRILGMALQEMVSLFRTLFLRSKKHLEYFFPWYDPRRVLSSHQMDGTTQTNCICSLWRPFFFRCMWISIRVLYLQNYELYKNNSYWTTIYSKWWGSSLLRPGEWQIDGVHIRVMASQDMLSPFCTLSHQSTWNEKSLQKKKEKKEKNLKK